MHFTPQEDLQGDLDVQFNKLVFLLNEAPSPRD